MDVVKVGELNLIIADDLLSYVPICNAKGGYITEESGGELKLREFTFSVAKFTKETLDIPPYFMNKQFCVMYGACVDELVIDTYGGETTELAYLKFTGESLDNLTALLQRIKKSVYIESTKSKRDFDECLADYFCDNVLRVSFERKVNRRGDPYYACLFEAVPAEHPEFTKKLRGVGFTVPQNISRIRSNPAISPSTSTSTSTSADYRDNGDRNRSLPSASNGEDYGF